MQHLAIILSVFGRLFCQSASLTLSLAQFLACIMQWITSQDASNYLSLPTVTRR